jgi:hypothetical protein
MVPYYCEEPPILVLKNKIKKLKIMLFWVQLFLKKIPIFVLVLKIRPSLGLVLTNLKPTLNIYLNFLFWFQTRIKWGT